MEQDPKLMAAGDQISAYIRNLTEACANSHETLVRKGIDGAAADEIVRDMIHQVMQGTFNKPIMFGGE